MRFKIFDLTAAMICHVDDASGRDMLYNSPHVRPIHPECCSTIGRCRRAM